MSEIALDARTLGSERFVSVHYQKGVMRNPAMIANSGGEISPNPDAMEKLNHRFAVYDC